MSRRGQSRQMSASDQTKKRDNPYSHLTKDELQRLHSSLFGHKSSLGEDTIAKAVTLKAFGGTASIKPRGLSASLTRSNSIREGEAVKVVATTTTASTAVPSPPPTVAFARNSSKWSHDNGDSQKPQATVLTRPVWDRLTAPPQTLSNEMQSWAKSMGTDFTFPLKAANTRRGFLQSPLRIASQEHWKRACEAGDVHVMNSLRACVVHTSAGGSRPRKPPKQRACWCTSTQPETDAQEAGNDDQSNPHNHNKSRADIINAALAHWKLNRIIEQGSSYLYYVCRGAKNRATALSANLSGMYIIPDGAFVDDVVGQVKRQRSKVRVIQALNDNQYGTADEGDSTPDEVGDDDVGDDPDYGKEDGEYLDGRVREPSDLFQFPSIEVSLKDNNLLSLKVHMSDAQVRFLLRGAKEEDPGSRSTFALDAEAVCVGDDCWFMITGMWRKRLIWVLRDSLNPDLIDSIIIDGVCWEKRRFDDGAKATDPFQCTQCGNVRRGDNVSYSSRNISTIRRGKYRCLICGVPTIHVSMRVDTFRPRPRWDPTSGHPLTADHCASCKEVEAAGNGAGRH